MHRPDAGRIAAVMLSIFHNIAKQPEQDYGSRGRYRKKHGGIPVLTRYHSLIYSDVTDAFKKAWAATGDFPHGKSRQVLRAEYRRYCKSRHLNWRLHDWREMTT